MLSGCMRAIVPRLGHPLIDRQHRRIEAVGRRMMRAAAAGHGLAELGELMRVTERHFATEERLMQGIAYPEMAGHRALHQGVLADMRRMRIQLRRGLPLHHKLVIQVVDWLGHHADAADRNLVEHLNAARVG